MRTVRLQKLLAERGIASRRKAAEQITTGRVAVNGVVAREPGFRVNPRRDTVTVDGRQIPAAPSQHARILLYKPAGYVCSTDGQGSPTVYDLVGDVGQRLFPVGRLDKDSEGLVLLTSDGKWAQQMAHPRYQHEKTYQVQVRGAVTPPVLARLRSRMEIDGYRIQPARVRILRREGPRKFLLEFVLREGRNRQIRRMCGAAGLEVLRLVRTKLAGFTLAGLSPGRWKEV